MCVEHLLFINLFSFHIVLLYNFCRFWHKKCVEEGVGFQSFNFYIFHPVLKVFFFFLQKEIECDWCLMVSLINYLFFSKSSPKVPELWNSVNFKDIPSNLYWTIVISTDFEITGFD